MSEMRRPQRQLRSPARLTCEFAHLVQGEVFLVDGLEGDALQPGDDVIEQNLLFLGAFEDADEEDPVVGGGVLADKLTAVEGAVRGQQVGLEALTKVIIDVGNSAVAAGELAEVLEGAHNVGAWFVGNLLEVVDEVDAATGAVGKAELLFEDGYLSLGAYCFGNFELLGVVAALDLSLGVFLQVDAQVFAAALQAGAGIPDRWPEVQVERNLAARELAFAEGDFGC